MASMRHCRSCLLKAQCCPKAPFRRVPRSIYEEARDVARALAKTEAFERSRHDRKRVEMLFAHLKRILRLGRLRLRGPAQFEFTLAAIAQNLRRLAKFVARSLPLPGPPIFADPRLAGGWRLDGATAVKGLQVSTDGLRYSRRLSSRILASFKSAVPTASVNQP
jgi:hypothetical protein